ncbi:MAG: chain length-determining protein [Gammaproteobacteria bacterium]|nr:chain length-determining protein [Gammaproteobacteria bacterium]
MHEIFSQILTYVRGTWRYRWWILSIAWIVSAAGWVFVASLPDQYKASARVYVDTDSILKPLLGRTLVSAGESRRLALMAKALFSRPNLEKLMRMTDLDLQAKTKEETEEIITELLAKLKLIATRDVNLYTISYDDEDPELAKLVVKSFLTMFVESSLGDSRKDQDSARQFLERQIAEYERRLEEAEEKQALFKRKNISYLADKGGGYYENLSQHKTMLTQAELELRIQSDRLVALQEQMEDAEDEEYLDEEIELGEAMAVSSVYDGRIAALQSNLDEMLMRFTDKHPDVVGTRRTLQELEEKRRNEAVATVASSSDVPSSNPVYQQLRLAYADAKAEVAAKQTVVSEYKDRIAKLEAAVDRVLQVESEQQQLNRDYSLLKSQHQKFLSSLENAKVSHDVDTRSGAVRFRIIDPPQVPATPSGPPRMLFSSGALIAGLGLGVTIAFLLSQLRPTFDDRRSLNEIMDLPVLGSVSMVWTQQQLKMRQKRHLGFLFVLFALVVTFGMVSAAYMLEIDWFNYIGSLRKIAGI